MSQHGFDEVSQGLGTSVWRRRGVKLLAAIALGGVVSLFGTSGAHGARCKLVGQRCRQSSECCGGFCDPAGITSRCPAQTMFGFQIPLADAIACQVVPYQRAMLASVSFF